jgi:SAM-dependent methyltransferase
MNEKGIWSNDEKAIGHRHSEALAKAIVSILEKDKYEGQVYDLGCGDGYYTRYFNDHGFECTGYDGNPGTSDWKDLIKFDLTESLHLDEKGAIVCLEVGEHIPRQFEEQLLNNITNNTSGKVILSWAVKGQGGLGHVNEQENYYVQMKFNERNFRLNGPQTELLRAAVKNCPCWWFASTLLVFDKNVN